MATGDQNNVVIITQKRGPTINGKKPLLYLDQKDRRVILTSIRKGWQELLDLHFEAEGGISDDKVRPHWKPLSERHLRYKENNNLLEGILEMNLPTLATRYKQSIKINPKTFNITIAYPELIGDLRKNKGEPVTAIVHQKRESGSSRPIRRIVLKDFKTLARKKTFEYLSGKS